MSFLVDAFERVMLRQRYPKSKIAAAIEKPPSYISGVLAGTRVPDDKTARRINFLLTYLATVEVAGQGFVFDRAGVALLRRKIREMESSAVKSERSANSAAVEESANA